MGLLDWLTDGGGSLWSSGGGEGSNPMVQATNNYQGPGGAPDMGPPGVQPPMQQPAPPQAMPPGLNGDFDKNGLMPPGGAAPPGPPPAMPPGLPGPNAAPSPQGGDPMAGTGSGNNGGLPPGLPIPSPQAPPPQARPSPMTPLTPEGASDAYAGYQKAGGGGPVQIAGQPQDTASTSGLRLPDMKGGGGLLGALGVDDPAARRFTGSLAAGFKAAGNSSGKSKGQALASGIGEGLEGGEKAMKENNDQTHKYLGDAIKAQAAGDEVGYKTNYLKYLQAKLKADTDKAASGGAKAQASNSPQQLYLSAIRATNSDPALKGYNDAIRAARATGDTAAMTKAQAELEAKKAEISQGHFSRLGIDPQTAQQLGQQPGFSDKNPVDAGKMGITEKNISQKLQPGQFYRNPKDGQIYQFTGGPGGGKIPTKPTSPEPANPMKPERGTRASSGGADENEEAA